jgi:hypothetical protein
MTAMTREELAAENARRIEEMRTVAAADVLTLREETMKFLRAKLPGTYRMECVNAKVWGDQIERRIVIVTEDVETFTLRFYVVQKSNRWGRNTSFQPCISGTEYQRERRTFRPLYEKRKDGSYNLKNMLADIERCIEWKRYQTSLNKCRDDSRSKSDATLEQVKVGLGWAPKPYDARTIEREVGDFRVTINAGEYSNGAVRVQVKLKDEYLTAEAALALIAKLETLK